MDPLEHRRHAARLANQSRAAGTPSDWFEPMYQWADGNPERVPWADLTAHPLLTSWAPLDPLGNVAVVGCGLGHDAEWLAKQANSVWAFDISHTAIEWAKRLFPNSGVVYEHADLFRLPEHQIEAFDTVVEIYTLQALSPESRLEAMRGLVQLMRPGGGLLVITRIREESEPLEAVPWPLTRAEINQLESLGLVMRESSEHERHVREWWVKPTR